MDKFNADFTKADIIICDYETRLSFLAKREALAPGVKFFTKNELRDALLGRTHEAALLYILAHKNHPYEYAKSLLNELPLLRTSEYSLKTAALSDLETELRAANIITADPLFKLQHRHKNVFVPAYLEADEQLQALLQMLEANVTYFTMSEKRDLTLITYENGYLEVYDVLNEISRLLTKGVLPQNINVVLNDEDYLLTFKRFASQFNLMFNTEAHNLLSYEVVVALFHEFRNALNLAAHIESFLAKEEEGVLLLVQNILSKYPLTNIKNSDYLLFLKEKLARTNFVKEVVDAINIVTHLPDYSKDKIYFIPNFAFANYPGNKKPTSLLNAKEREHVGKAALSSLNTLNKAKWANALNANNVRLSFAPRLGSAEYLLSPFVSELNISIKKATMPKTFYSQAYVNFYYALLLDERRHYDVLREEFTGISGNTQAAKYRSYSHAFKPFALKHDAVRLSFTKLTLFQSIPFDYFAQVHLKLENKDEQAFPLMYGTFVHQVIEKTKHPNMFDQVFNDALGEYAFTPRDIFTVVSEKELVRAAVLYRFKVLDYIGNAKTKQEQFVNIPLYSKHSFVGFIDDLIMFEHRKQKYALVLDYKTGQIRNNVKHQKYGLDLQLPIYAMLLNKSKEFHEYKLAGLFMQSIKAENYANAKHLDLEKHYNDVLRYKGLFTFDKDVLKVFAGQEGADNPLSSRLFTRGGSEIHGSLKGNELKEEHIKTATNVVYETLQSILNNDFPVTYKKIGAYDTREYSDYKDISYIKYSDRYFEIEEGDEDTDE